MADFWEEAWRKAETVEFSAATVEADGKQFPQFARDGFGSVFEFRSAGDLFVSYEKVGEPFCFKLFKPDMTVRNLGRELFELAERGELKK